MINYSCLFTIVLVSSASAVATFYKETSTKQRNLRVHIGVYSAKVLAKEKLPRTLSINPTLFRTASTTLHL